MKVTKVWFRNEFIALQKDYSKIEALDFNGNYMIECYIEDEKIYLTGNGIDRHGNILIFSEDEVVIEYEVDL